MQAKTYNKILASILVVALAVILIIGLTPYVHAFFWALILFVLFLPLYKFLTKYTSKWFSSLLTIIATWVIILVPLSVLTPMVVGQINVAIANRAVILESVKAINAQFPSLNISQYTSEVVSNIFSYIKTELGSILGGVTDTVITVVILYFTLYFMFVNHKKLKTAFLRYMPFSQKHSKQLAQEFTTITTATVITTGIIALLQGVAMGIGFAVAGIPGAIFWGFLGTILAFFPVIGIPLLWIPGGVYLILTGNVFAGVGILIWGAILSNVDNFIRPSLQERFGRIHPLTTLIGVFIGVPIFGILGLILGPLLISYFFLLVRMYRDEFLEE